MKEIQSYIITDIEKKNIALRHKWLHFSNFLDKDLKLMSFIPHVKQMMQKFTHQK